MFFFAITEIFKQGLIGGMSWTLSWLTVSSLLVLSFFLTVEYPLYFILGATFWWVGAHIDTKKRWPRTDYPSA